MTDVATALALASTLAGALPELGNLVAELTNGVTDIVAVVNRSGKPVDLVKVDRNFLGIPTPQSVRVAPKSTLKTSLWLPWAENAQDYALKHLTLSLGGRPFAHLWQQAGRVRFNTQDAFVPNGSEVPILAKGGGRRTLVVDELPGGPAFVVAGLTDRVDDLLRPGDPAGQPTRPDFTDGALVKERGHAAVYVVYGGARFGIPSVAEFDALGYSWSDVRELPPGALAASGIGAIPRDGTLVKERSHDAVYVVRGGQKRHITSPQRLVALGFSWGDVRVVPNGALAGIPAGPPA
jgi:hypothetical protein